MRRSARAWHGWSVSDEAVYYGHVGGAGELYDVRVAEGADHDGVDVAGQDAARVRGVSRLPSWISSGSSGARGRRAGTSHLEGDAGPVGWLLEDHRQRTTAQRPVGDAALLQRLYANGLVQDQGHLLGGELSECQAVAAR